MSLTEQKNKTAERRKQIEEVLAFKFLPVWVNGNRAFQKTDGSIFCLCSIPDDGAIVIEYAENCDEALLNRFEDGDRLYLDEMSEEEMLQAVFEEIEQ